MASSAVSSQRAGIACIENPIASGDVVSSYTTWVVIPAYNEDGSLREVVSPLAASRYRVVVVDDGSQFPVQRLLKGLNVSICRHVVNLGQGAALQTGIRYALSQGARYIVTFDADGQHDPEDIPKLLDRLVHGGCDVALGSRFLAGGAAVDIPLLRKIVLHVALFIFRMTSGLKLTDVHNGLRAFSAEAASKLRITQNGMAHASQILSQIERNRFRYGEVPVRIVYTDYSLAKGQRVSNAFNILWEILTGGIWR